MAVLEKERVEKPKALKLPDNIQEEIAICEQSRKKLSFTAPLSVEAEKWVGIVRGARLSQILHDLCIPVYSTQSVQEYKATMQGTENQKFRASIIRGLMFGIIIGTLVGFGASMLCKAINQQLFIAEYLAIAIILGIFFGGMSFNTIINLWEPSCKKWRRDKLEYYSNHVPTRALALALAVQAKIPEVIFQIEYFADHAEVADPFLIASAGDRKYYVAVWDEEGFKE